MHEIECLSIRVLRNQRTKLRAENETDRLKHLATVCYGWLVIPRTNISCSTSIHVLGSKFTCHVRIQIVLRNEPYLNYDYVMQILSSSAIAAAALRS